MAERWQKRNAPLDAIRLDLITSPLRVCQYRIYGITMSGHCIIGTCYSVTVGIVKYGPIDSEA
jgi:hypothetical protein